MKIAGAIAQRGHNLEEVTKLTKLVSQNIATYGVGLAACTLPGLFKFINFLIKYLFYNFQNKKVYCHLSLKT